MKRLVAFLMAILLFSGGILQAHAQEVSYRIFVDGKIVSLSPGVRIEQGNLMVPLAPIFQQLGYSIQLDPYIKKRITIKNNKNIITHLIGTQNLYLNGTLIQMKMPSEIYKGATYLPLNSIAQAVNKPIGNNAKEGYAWLGSKPASIPAVPPETQGKDFRNAVWGMTVEQVRKTETLPLSRFQSYEDDYYDGPGKQYFTDLKYRGSYFGFKADFYYLFSGKQKNKGLFDEASIDFPERFSNIQNYVDRFFKISAEMKKAYGPPKHYDYSGTDGYDLNQWGINLSLSKLDLEEIYIVGRNEYRLKLYKNYFDDFPHLIVMVGLR